MNIDEFGVVFFSSNEVADLLYKDPTLDLRNFKVNDALRFNNSVSELFADMPVLTQYRHTALCVDEFDNSNQANWFIPEEYKSIDIVAYILSLCKTDAELQRVGEELLLFQERGLFGLLCFLKYFIDTLRKNKIVWGVGRGSSVASYVLYLLGVHKINSMYYDLDIAEFLK
jgi:DNA polymerase III alpha subunit